MAAKRDRFLECTQESLRQDPSTICVACPYCTTMFKPDYSVIAATLRGPHPT